MRPVHCNQGVVVGGPFDPDLADPFKAGDKRVFVWRRVGVRRVGVRRGRGGGGTAALALALLEPV